MNKNLKTLMKSILLIPILVFFLFSQTTANGNNLSLKLAKTIMSRYPDPDDYPYRSWCYPQGYMLLGMARLWSTTGDQKYYDYIMKYVEKHVDDEGNIDRFKGNSMDDMMTGAIIVWAYRQTKLRKYKIAAGRIRERFKDYPRTEEGLFWHGRKTVGQVWIDGVFMGQMFLINYGKYIGESSYCFDEAARQITLIQKHLHKNKSGLLYHAWDEDKDAPWADPQTGISPEVWSEGLGWYALVLVETLEIFPADHPKRSELIKILKDLTAGLRQNQDSKTGLWFQIVDKAQLADNWHDTSGSAMFVYAIQKAIEMGLIDSTVYSPIVKKGYEGILAKAKTNNNGLIDIVDACDGLCVQNSYDIYINYEKTINAKEAVAGVLWGSWIVEKPTK